MSNQAVVFLWTVLAGVLIGMVYDLFRVFRKLTRPSNIVVFVQDIIFWIIVSLILFAILYISNDGAVRVYTFIGAALGAVFFFLTISPMFIKIAVNTIRLLRYSLKVTMRVLSFPILLLYCTFKNPARCVRRIISNILKLVHRKFKFVIRKLLGLKKVFWKIRRKL